MASQFHVIKCQYYLWIVTNSLLFPPAFQPPLVFKSVQILLSLLSVQYTEMTQFEGVLWPTKKVSQSVNTKFNEDVYVILFLKHLP